MECPKCNGKTKVNDTGHFEGMVYRRRECLKCGYNFYTEESFLAENEKEPALIAMRLKMPKTCTGNLLKRIDKLYKTC